MRDKNKRGGNAVIDQPIEEQVQPAFEPAAIEQPIEPTTDKVSTVLTQVPSKYPAYITYEVLGKKVWFSKALFIGAAPDTITLDGIALTTVASNSKETKEERKARLAARTPEMIASDARAVADKAAKRAAQLAEKAAKLTPVSEMPASDTTEQPQA